ncbi:hypothetical protein [Usitatibacter palustris]|uniref:hypothetical protein n=1 Tax=Usitatibacter palustris TaxID=2732487 RepID=UPI001BB0FE9A|nr:hypothetical protein [Usitatibacter palustris]
MGQLAEAFVRDRVKYVGVVGPDCSKIEDIIDDAGVGDGSSPWFILTASHEGETLEDAIAFAESLSDEYAGEVQIVEI